MERISPGCVLLREFLMQSRKGHPGHTTVHDFAGEAELPETLLIGIIGGMNVIDSAVAVRLAAALGTSAGYWLGLQERYDASADDKPV